MAKEMKFEEKMAKLEELVNELEKEDIKIDDSIEKYKEAIGLVNECNKQLKSIEEQIAKIVEDDGTISDFKAEE